MSNAYYIRSAKRENELAADLGQRGWFAFRSPGSRGPADVVAMRPGKVMLIQVKTGGKRPYEGFKRKERMVLLAAAERAGADAWLVWWPSDRGGPRWYAPYDWPSPERRKLDREIKLETGWFPAETGYGTECWLWDGLLQPNGYGILAGGKGTRSAHRLMYELKVGPVPEGMDLDHLCRVRRCVNPDHLEPVTRRENLRRGAGGRLWLSDAVKFQIAWMDATTRLSRKEIGEAMGVSGRSVTEVLGCASDSSKSHSWGRRPKNRTRAEEFVWEQSAAPRTHCYRGHELCGDNVVTRGGKSTCRECERVRGRRRSR